MISKKMSTARRSELLALYADLMDDEEREEWIANGMPVEDEELEATVGSINGIDDGDKPQDREWTCVDCGQRGHISCIGPDGKRYL